MMKFLNIFKFFSLYTDSFEKKVDKFLRHVKRRSNTDLQVLIQEDLVKLTVFLEYKFKAYKKLKKRYRRKLYDHAELIRTDFQKFLEAEEENIQVSQHAPSIPPSLRSDRHFRYLLAIMKYLKPGGRLQYKEASTFEKLLRDPAKEKLIGDCNQIVTLYIYLFSFRYPVTELQVKILPNHICLHYKGVDIETTSGMLADYDEYTFVSPVEEIIATNVLDIADPTEKQYQVSPRNVLKSAEFAFRFSGHRATVEKNLFSAYHNMAVFYARQKNFSKARLFANKSGNTKLQTGILRMEAGDHLKNKRYDKALDAFRKAGDKAGEKACYQNQLADLFSMIKDCKTLSQYKNRRSTLYRMKELALKVDNQELVRFVNDILRKLDK